MTIVRLRTQVGGFRDGRAWPPPGSLVELPDHEADPFILSGYGWEDSPEEGEVVHWSEGTLDHAASPTEPDAPASAEPDAADAAEPDAPASAEPGEGTGAGDGPALDALTKDELIAVAAERGVEVRKSWSISKIIDALKG